MSKLYSYRTRPEAEAAYAEQQRLSRRPFSLFALAGGGWGFWVAIR